MPDQLSRSLSSSGFSGTAGDSAMFASEMAVGVGHSQHMHTPVFSTKSPMGPMWSCVVRSLASVLFLALYSSYAHSRGEYQASLRRRIESTPTHTREGDGRARTVQHVARVRHLALHRGQLGVAGCLGRSGSGGGGPLGERGGGLRRQGLCRHVGGCSSSKADGHGLAPGPRGLAAVHTRHPRPSNFHSTIVTLFSRSLSHHKFVHKYNK